jgi:hypothetical protein
MLFWEKRDVLQFSYRVPYVTSTSRPGVQRLDVFDNMSNLKVLYLTDVCILSF